MKPTKIIFTTILNSILLVSLANAEGFSATKTFKLQIYIPDTVSIVNPTNVNEENAVNSINNLSNQNYYQSYEKVIRGFEIVTLRTNVIK